VAAATAIGGGRPQHRTPRGGDNPIGLAVALDWANGQVVAVGAGSAPGATFDASNDRLVSLSVSTNTWYTVGPTATATATKQAATSEFIASGAQRWVYVPAGMTIAVIQDTAGGFASMVAGLTAQ